MLWRHLEDDEAFKLLYDRQQGAIGRRIVDLEKLALEPTTEPVLRERIINQLWGLRRVQLDVADLAKAEAEDQINAEAEKLRQYPSPADSPFPRTH